MKNKKMKNGEQAMRNQILQASFTILHFHYCFLRNRLQMLALRKPTQKISKVPNTMDR